MDGVLTNAEKNEFDIDIDCVIDGMMRGDSVASRSKPSFGVDERDVSIELICNSCRSSKQLFSLTTLCSHFGVL